MGVEQVQIPRILTKLRLELILLAGRARLMKTWGHFDLARIIRKESDTRGDELTQLRDIGKHKPAVP